MPPEGYLFIFLLASTLIFVFFYATRARNRNREPMSRIKRTDADKPHGADVTH